MERAVVHCRLLDDLLDVIPEELWSRRAASEAWTARNHLEHLTTADDLLAGDLARVVDGARHAPGWAAARTRVVSEDAS